MRHKNLSRIALIGILILIAALAAGCGGKEAPPSEDLPSPDSFVYVFPEEDHSGPGLANFATLDINGETVSQDIFSEYEITMVNVWGTFCSPCLAEMPDLGEIKQEYESKGVNIIGIVADSLAQDGSIDTNQVEKAQNIVEDTKAGYVHLIPSENLLSGLLKDVIYIPHTVFVDKEGNLIGSEFVGSRSKEEWTAIIDALL